MQTHKNVGELGAYYNGHILDKKDLRVFHDATQHQWYINAREARFKLDYPIIYDSIFQRRDNNPSYRLVRMNSNFVYHPVSESTARVLMRSDGFSQLHVLAEEINRHDAGSWTSSPHFTKSYNVSATLDGDSTCSIPANRVPIRSPFVSKILKNIDFIVIDIPGTLAYNVAIPFVAPFVFFYEFSHDKS